MGSMMIYRYALFRHKYSFWGGLCELFVVALFLFSIALPLISETLLSLQVSSALWVFCFILFFVFSRSDKLRRSMHG